MKRKRNILLVGLLLLAGLVFWSTRSPEPIAQGRPLSAWLEELVSLNEQRPSVEADLNRRQTWEARHQPVVLVVRSIGPRALPYLLGCVRSAPGPSPWRDKLEQLIEKQSVVVIHLPQRRDLSDQTYVGFEALGSLAAPALPELGEMLLDPSHAYAAAACLGAIGPPGFPVLLGGLTNSNPGIQYVAFEALIQICPKLGPSSLSALFNAVTNSTCLLRAGEYLQLGNLGPSARELTPWLERCMRDPANPMAGPAMRLITEVGDHPEQHLQFFADRLTDTRFGPDAAFALARLGPQGVPPLLQALTNQNPTISAAVLAALSPQFRRTTPRPAAKPSGYWFSGLAKSFDYRRATRGKGPLSVQPFSALSTSLVLAQLLDHPEAAVRLRVVQLLRPYGRFSALGLSRAAGDQDETVRQEARTALAALDLEASDGAITRGPKASKRIALVFAGHQYAEGGQIILEELARHHAQASFFLTGDFLTNQTFWPLVRRIYEDGHFLGPHSDKHLLYCSWEKPAKTLVTREQFEDDFQSNLNGLSQLGGMGQLPGFFVPPYEHCNFQIAAWAANYFYLTIKPTPGTRSTADCTGEADRNFVSSQAILDSVLGREREDTRGLNGFILLFHLGAGPNRTDKFYTRFGELLDALTAGGYEFVAVDDLFDPGAALRRQSRRTPFVEPSRPQTADAMRRRYGLGR